MASIFTVLVHNILYSVGTPQPIATQLNERRLTCNLYASLKVWENFTAINKQMSTYAIT
jgi:hypothetical protein